MSENKISIKPISDLHGCNFFIPSYQRGYRWTDQQVTDLLNDVWEFINKQNKKEDEWYCLQPIVVKKIEENRFELIDGQQRLTTLFLVLKYMKKVLPFIEMKFSLSYQTRTKSEKFLESLDENLANDNIDFFHIFNAYSLISKWFADESTGEKNLKAINLFKYLGESVKVIWYETTDSDSIEIFTRINSGKIPLTNSELIKALFLNSSNFEKADNEKLRLKQLKIASEWDTIEYALQDDSFWYFINKNDNNIPTRIEFIFNLMYEIAQDEDNEVKERKLLGITGKEKIDERTKTNPTILEKFGNDEYATFRFFQHKFKSKTENEINKNWKEIKNYFQTLEEWHNDKELYHKIGYLITIGAKIKDILKDKKDKSKKDFANVIDDQIAKQINTKAIEELEYGSDNAQLTNILLLHNILSVLKSEDNSLKFPFNKYKDKENGGWSLEHIHAQNSESITEIDDFDEWLKSIDEKEFDKELTGKINDYKSNKSKEKITELVKKISLSFGETEIHSIENLALLSRNDNSKLNNGLFPVKRERIIELEQKGRFIPIATKKVFQKNYSGCTKQLSKWESIDREAYLNDIKETMNLILIKVVENEQ